MLWAGKKGVKQSGLALPLALIPAIHGSPLSAQRAGGLSAAFRIQQQLKFGLRPDPLPGLPRKFYLAEFWNPQVVQRFLQAIRRQPAADQAGVHGVVQRVVKRKAIGNAAVFRRPP